MKRRDFLKLVGGTGWAVTVSNFANPLLALAKEDFPSSKITWVLGHPPGGGIDLLARGVSAVLEKQLKAVSPAPDKVGVLIKNLPGGAEMRAMNELYHARPDGYTIASGGDILHTRSLFGELGFDLFDITFLGRISSGSKILVTGARTAIKSWDDVVKASQKAPVRIAITGFGASNHVASVLFIDTTRLSAKPVIFDGTAGANGALMRGDTALGINSEDSLKTLIEAKELRPILDFSEKSDYPGVPSIKDLGFPELIEPIKSQRYVIAPPRLPANIRKIYEDALKKTLADKDFIAWNKKAGISLDPVFGADLDKLVRSIQDFYKGKEKVLKEYLKES